MGSFFASRIVHADGVWEMGRGDNHDSIRVCGFFPDDGCWYHVRTLYFLTGNEVGGGISKLWVVIWMVYYDVRCVGTQQISVLLPSSYEHPIWSHGVYTDLWCAPNRIWSLIAHAVLNVCSTAPWWALIIGIRNRSSNDILPAAMMTYQRSQRTVRYWNKRNLPQLRYKSVYIQREYLPHQESMQFLLPDVLFLQIKIWTVPTQQ